MTIYSSGNSRVSNGSCRLEIAIKSIVIFNVAICGVGPTTNSRPLWFAGAVAAAWVWLGPAPQGAQNLCAPAATEAVAVSVKATRAMVTRRRSVAISLEGGRGRAWIGLRLGVLALGSCSGARRSRARRWRVCALPGGPSKFDALQPDGRFIIIYHVLVAVPRMASPS